MATQRAYNYQEAQQQGLGWVPEGHSLFGTQGYAGYAPDASAAAAPAATPPAQMPIDDGAVMNPVDEGLWINPGGEVTQGPSAATTSLRKPAPGTPGAPKGPDVGLSAPPPGAVDPFAALGGGVYANGGWTPKGMGLRKLV